MPGVPPTGYCPPPSLLQPAPALQPPGLTLAHHPAELSYSGASHPGWPIVHVEPGHAMQQAGYPVAAVQAGGQWWQQHTTAASDWAASPQLLHQAQQGDQLHQALQAAAAT